MTPAMRAAHMLDGVGPNRDASRVLGEVRRQGSEGATRGHCSHRLGLSAERVQRALTGLLDAGWIEVVPATGWPQRWRVTGGP